VEKIRKYGISKAIMGQFMKTMRFAAFDKDSIRIEKHG
jgi:hypothetical protein